LASAICLLFGVNEKLAPGRGAARATPLAIQDEILRYADDAKSAAS